MQQARLSIAIHRVDFALINFAVQVFAQNLQKYEIRPAVLRIVQISPFDIIVRMNTAADELLRPIELAILALKNIGIKQGVDGIRRPTARTVILSARS